jgi:hypothetical protein
MSGEVQAIIALAQQRFDEVEVLAEVERDAVRPRRALAVAEKVGREDGEVGASSSPSLRHWREVKPPLWRRRARCRESRMMRTPDSQEMWDDFLHSRTTRIRQDEVTADLAHPVVGLVHIDDGSGNVAEAFQARLGHLPVRQPATAPDRLRRVARLPDSGSASVLAVY